MCMDAVFGTDAWVVLLAFMVQDFPLLIIRIIIATVFTLEKNYTLYYLVGKNILLCLLEIYRVVVLMYEKVREELNESKNESLESEDKRNSMSSHTNSKESSEGTNKKNKADEQSQSRKIPARRA